MTTRCITAFEHQAIRVGDGSADGLSEAEADALCRIGELRKGFCRRGAGVVELSQYCGVVGLGQRALEVLPKVDHGDPPEFCRGILLRLLRLAEDVPVFRHVSVGQHLRSAPLLEVFIAAFLETVTELVRGGLLSQYEEREDDLGVLRGRIQFSRQLGALMNRKDRIACRYDELTPDNAWNRAVKLGLLAVRPWITRDELARRWAVAACAFDEIPAQHHPPVDLSRLVFSRQALRYRPAIEWVRWILEVLSPSFRAGEAAAPALLFDMNQVFESAVGSAIRRTPCPVATGPRTAEQRTGDRDCRHEVEARRRRARWVSDPRCRGRVPVARVRLRLRLRRLGVDLPVA
jgi:5-methylcytosine-specific restriction enzyme subunit McrC